MRRKVVSIALALMFAGVGPADAADPTPAEADKPNKRQGCPHWKYDRQTPEADDRYLATAPDDPFYAQPDPMPCAPFGTILKYREITFTPGIEMPQYEAWHLKFLSTDTYGSPIAAVTTVVKPRNAIGPLRLVSFQDPTNNVGATCGPSHYYSGTGNNTLFAADGYRLVAALEAGWTVAAPDWGGHLFTFGTSIEAGHVVLDGIRAAQSFAPLGLTDDTPAGLFGFSNGTPSTFWAGMLQEDYAPDLNVVGMVSGGTLVSLRTTAQRIEEDPALNFALFSGMFANTISVSRVYPDFFPVENLNARGRAAAAAVRDGCLGGTTDGSPPPQGKLSDYTKPDPEGRHPLDLPGAQDFYDQVEPLRVGRVPSIDTYVYHGLADQGTSIDEADELVEKWCDAGVSVHYNRVPTEHFSSESQWPDGLRFLESRVDGTEFVPTPTTRTCNEAGGERE